MAVVMTAVKTNHRRTLVKVYMMARSEMTAEKNEEINPTPTCHMSDMTVSLKGIRVLVIFTMSPCGMTVGHNWCRDTMPPCVVNVILDFHRSRTFRIIIIQNVQIMNQRNTNTQHVNAFFF